MLISNAEVCCFLFFHSFFAFSICGRRRITTQQDDTATRQTRDHRIIYNFLFLELNAKIQMRCVIDAPPSFRSNRIILFVLSFNVPTLSLSRAVARVAFTTLPLFDYRSVRSFNLWYAPPGSDTRRCDESLFVIHLQFAQPNGNKCI